VIRARGVSFAFPGRPPALEGVDIEVAPGEVVFLLGPNGAGKSTLLRLLSGELAPTAGTVEVEGADARTLERRALARRVAVVPQETLATFPYTVGELALMGRAPFLPRFALESEADVGAAERALRALDLWELRDRPIGDVSGGERRRAAIARALAQEAPALLLDEPTAFLDVRHRVLVFRLLTRLAREERRAVLVVSHDLDAALETADRAVLLSRGRIVAAGAPLETLTPARLREVFGAEAEVLRSPADGRASLTFPITPRPTP